MFQFNLYIHICKKINFDTNGNSNDMDDSRKQRVLNRLSNIYTGTKFAGINVCFNPLKVDSQENYNTFESKGKELNNFLKSKDALDFELENFKHTLKLIEAMCGIFEKYTMVNLEKELNN